MRFPFWRVLGVTVAMLAAAPAVAQERSAAAEPVIPPQVDRRKVTVPHIDASDIEVTAYFGMFSIENFGTSSVYGGRIAYHVTERMFLEGTYGLSTVSDEFYRERALPVFSSAEQDVSYYNVSIGYNLLPGESFLTKTWAMSSAFYVVAGIGSTKLADDSFSTMNFGFGYRVLLTDWFALHIDMRDHVFNSDLLGANQRTNNFELTTGVSVFF